MGQRRLEQAEPTPPEQQRCGMAAEGRRRDLRCGRVGDDDLAEGRWGSDRQMRVQVLGGRPTRRQQLGVRTEGGVVRQLVEFGSGEDGASVLVEIDQEDPGFDRVSRSGRPVQAAQSLRAALDAVLPAARVMVAKAQTISPHTSEVEVQFGVRLTASAGPAAIASAGGEGHFQLRVLCCLS